MADVQKTFRFNFDFNKNDVKKQLKEVSLDVKDFIADIGKASDKVSIFKDFVGYIDKVDAALGRFKVNNKDVFNQVFAGLDGDLKQHLEQLFNIDDAKITLFNSLKEQVDKVGKGNVKIEKLKTMAQSINELLQSVGAEHQLDMSMFDAYGGTTKERVDAMRGALDQFVLSWQNVQEKLRQGFTVGGGGGTGGPKTLTDGAQAAINNLEEKISHANTALEDFKRAANNALQYNKGNDMELHFDATEEKALELVDALSKLSHVKEKLDSGSLQNEQDLQDLAKYTELATQLVGIQFELQDNGSMNRVLRDKIDATGAEDFVESINKKLIAKISTSFDGLVADINSHIDAIKADSSSYVKVDGSAPTTGGQPSSGDGIVSGVGKTIDELEYTLSLAGQLKNMFDTMRRRTDFEYNISINGLDVKAFKGDEKQVSYATQVESYLNNLFSSSAMYGHSHRGGSQSFNISDMLTYLGEYQEALNSFAFVVGGEGIQTLNLNGIDVGVIEDVKQAIDALNDNKQSPLRVDQVNQIIEKITGVKNVLRSWDTSQIDELAQYMYDVGKNATNALAPVEKMQIILDNLFGKGKVDLSTYSDLTNQLNKDNVTDIFNKILSKEGLSQIGDNLPLTMQQVSNEIDENITKYRLLREEANLTYDEIKNEVAKIINHWENGGGTSSQLDFFQQYFPEGEWQNFRDQLAKAYDGLISIEEVQNRIANEFGVDPDTFAKIPTGYGNGGRDDSDTGAGSDDDAVNDDREAAELEELRKKLVEVTQAVNDKTDAFTTEATEVETVVGREKQALTELEERLNTIKELVEKIFNPENKQLFDNEQLDGVITQLNDIHNKFQALGTEFSNICDTIKSIQGMFGETGTQNPDLTDDEIEDARKERGTLDEKLDRLYELSNEHGVDISQAKRNRYEDLNQKEMNGELTAKQEEAFSELGEAISEADDALEEFGATYEKIILKFADGKKNVEIMPDDAGLKKLFEYSDSYGSGEYNGREISDVEFIRTPESVINTDPKKQMSIQIDTGKLDQFASDLTKKLDDSATTFSGKLEQASSDFATKFDASAQNLTENLNQAVSGFNTKLESNVNSVVASQGNLTTAIDNLTAAMLQPDTTVADADAERTQQIEVMKKNLLQVFDSVNKHNNQIIDGKHTQQETAAEFFSDGSVSLGYGENGSVEWKTMIQSLLSNLMSQSIMSMHSHPWGDYFGSMPGVIGDDLIFANDAFSGSTGDLSAWKTTQKYGAQIGSMLTGNILRTFDVGKISDKYTDFIRNLIDTEKEYVDSGNYSQYIGRNDITGSMYFKHQANLEGYHEVGNTFRAIMLDALKNTGFSDSEIGNIYKEYNLTDEKELTDLATTLVDLSVSAKSAASPVEALKDLLIALGTSSAKSDVDDAVRKMRGVANGTSLGNADFEYYMAKKRVQSYAGNMYDKELLNIDSLMKTGDSDDMRKAANELAEIANKLGADIEGKEGQLALEAFRKGEMSAADVWNAYSDFTKVSQEAIDNMRVIDASKEDSAEVQLMSRMSSTLDSINSSVASIEANTQKTLSQQLDTSAQTLIDVIGDSNLLKVAKNQQSLFDADNVSEFKVQELFNVAERAVETFRNQFESVHDKDMWDEEVSPAETQKMYDLFATAVARANDAKLQLNAYQGRYEGNITSDSTGEVLDDDKVSYLFSSLSDNMQDMVELLVKAKNATNSQLGVDVQSSNNSTDILDSDNTSSLISCLSSLEGAIERLIGKLDAGIDFVPAQSTATNTLHGPLENVDISSEIEQCNQLLTVIERIEDAIDKKTDAFSHEKRTVDRVIPLEIETLRSLGDYLSELKDLIDKLFVNMPSSINMFESWKNDLAIIKQNIAGVLQDLRDIEEVSTRTTQTAEGANKDVLYGDRGYALENTLQSTNDILSKILGKIGDGDHFAKLVEPLNAAVLELKNVAKGIIEEQKAKKINTSDADKRISDPAEVANIKKAALDAVYGRVIDGGDSAVTSMVAMANGMVKVSGYVQTATDEWEGFTLQVNAANEASKIAYDVSAKAAKEAARAAKQQTSEDNPYRYDKSQVEARAQAHVDEYTKQGKQATVQFKDSGRYTITVLEEIDGLSKQIFQTFDENDAKIERTTATISNKQQIQLQDLQDLVKIGLQDKLIKDDDTAYKQYKIASDELERMNSLYRANDNLSDEDILKWNTQIKLVQQLGSSVEALIKKRKAFVTSDVFVSDRNKKLSKFDLDKTKLETDIAIPKSFDKDITDARTSIENAVDEDSLKIAVNNWEALKNKIKEAAEAQELYIKKSKETTSTKKTGAEKAAEENEKASKLRPAEQITGQANSELKLAGINPNARELTDEQKEIKTLYDQLMKQIQEYRTNVHYSQQVELDAINTTKDALYAKIDAYKQEHNIVNGNKKAYGATSIGTATTKYNALKNLAEDKEYKKSSVVQSKLAQYTAAYEHLVAVQSKFKSGEKITGDQEQEFNNARAACNKYAQELNKVLSASERAKENSSKHRAFEGDFVDDEIGRQTALKQFVEDMYGADATIDKFTDNFNKLLFTVDNGDGTFSQITAEINKSRSAIDASVKSTQEATGSFSAFWNELKGKFKSIGAYLMASMSFQEVWQQLRRGVEYVREIDSALTELKKVTDETDASYDKFLQDMAKTGSVIGATVADLTTMASEWARLGYSMEEAGKLAESTAILLNVSEFDDATAASEALISTMQAFQYTADESQHVVDILNEVGSKMPRLYSNI